MARGMLSTLVELRLARLELQLRLRQVGLWPWLVLVGWAAVAAAQEPRVMRGFGVVLTWQGVWAGGLVLLLVLAVSGPRRPASDNTGSGGAGRLRRSRIRLSETMSLRGSPVAVRSPAPGGGADEPLAVARSAASTRPVPSAAATTGAGDLPSAARLEVVPGLVVAATLTALVAVVQASLALLADQIMGAILDVDLTLYSVFGFAFANLPLTVALVLFAGSPVNRAATYVAVVAGAGFSFGWSTVWFEAPDRWTVIAAVLAVAGLVLLRLAAARRT